MKHNSLIILQKTEICVLNSSKLLLVWLALKKTKPKTRYSKYTLRNAGRCTDASSQLGAGISIFCFVDLNCMIAIQQLIVIHSKFFLCLATHTRYSCLSTDSSVSQKCSWLLEAKIGHSHSLQLVSCFLVSRLHFNQVKFRHRDMKVEEKLCNRLVCILQLTALCFHLLRKRQCHIS
jgi:hypothetical protein